MNKIELLSIAVAIAMDGCAASFTAGMNTKTVRPFYAIKLSFIIALFHMLLPILGWSVGIGLANKMLTINVFIAFILLSIVGIKMIVDNYKDLNKPFQVVNISYEYKFKIILGLAIATSIDASAVGLTFVCVGIKSIYVVFIDCLVIGVITFLLCICAVNVGCKFGSKFKNKTGYFGGGILLLIGIKMFIEKLIELI